MVLILWLLHKVLCQNISTKGWLLLIQTHVLLQKKTIYKECFFLLSHPSKPQTSLSDYELVINSLVQRDSFHFLNDNWNNLEVFIIKEHALFSNSAYQIGLFYFKSAFKARLFD